MRNLDILAAATGEHIRVLLCGEEQSYVVSCQHFRMPYPVASDLLAELQPVPAETYSVFVLDEDITNCQREGRNRKLDLIAPLLEDALSRRLSIDVLVSQLNQIVRVNHIGLLVIDELQNIAYRKSDGGIRFLNFLVHLINGAGVSVCMVGTPRVLQVLQQEFRAARRTTGLVYDRLPNDKEFALLLHGLWHYQYTQYATDLTPELENWLYRKTQGIPDILVKLLYNAQKQAILDGREKLDLEVFESAFLRNLGMVSEYISELSTKSVAKRQTKTAPEVSVGSAAPTKIVGNDIRALLKKAKKCGELPVSAYAEYIKGEVAI